MEDVNFLDPTNMASKLQNCVLSVIVEDDDGEDETNIGENLIQNVCEQANVDEKQVRDILLETAMLSISNDYSKGPNTSRVLNNRVGLNISSNQISA